MTPASFGMEIIRYFVGFLMLAAATGKLRTLADFRANLTSSFGVGAAFSAALAPAIIVLELAAAVLVLGPWSTTGMLASLLMLGLFTLVVCYKFFTQSVVKCSCFGEAGRSVSGIDLLRNGVVLVSIIAYLYQGGGVTVGLAAAILAAALAALLCVIAIEAHDIVTLLARY